MIVQNQSFFEKIHEKKHLKQFFSVISSSLVTEILTQSKVDSIVFDTQHSQINIESLRTQVLIALNNQVTPFIRIPDNQHHWCTQALDLGAQGVICPLINDRHACEHFVESCLYPPKGNRSAGPFLQKIRKQPNYLSIANESVITLAMIETQTGVDNIDDILKTPNLSGIYIGPNDLTLSCKDLPPMQTPFSQPLIDLICELGKKTLAAGKLFTVHCPSKQQAQVFYDVGAQCCTIEADYHLLIKACDDALKG